MNEQSQNEHIIFLRDFDLARQTAERNMRGQDGEADFRIAADRARDWMRRKDRHQAGRVLQEAKTAHYSSPASMVLAA